MKQHIYSSLGDEKSQYKVGLKHVLFLSISKKYMSMT